MRGTGQSPLMDLNKLLEERNALLAFQTKISKTMKIGNMNGSTNLGEFNLFIQKQIDAANEALLVGIRSVTQ